MMALPLLRWALWLALALCAFGFGWRLVVWLRRDVGPAGTGTGPGARLGAALRALLRGRAWAGLVLDGFLQRRLLAADPVAWAAHLALVASFTLLLVFHALGALVTEALVPTYAATASPWLLLRDLAGLLAVVGATALWLRRRGRVTRRSDPVLGALLALVLLSGFALQAAKTISAPDFYRMTEDFLGTSDPEDEDVAALSLAWAADFGVVFSGGEPEAPDEELLAYGRELSQDACASCHANPRTAFVSWPVSRALAPLAAPLARHDGPGLLFLLHVLACLVLLAWLPYGRLRHAVSDPLSVAAARLAPSPIDVTTATTASPAARALRRSLALDACVQCGLCDARCSVRGLVGERGDGVLPSVKLRRARDVLGGPADSPTALALTADHATCTDCRRCGAVCPVGIDLVDLWDALRGGLGAAGWPAPPLWVKGSGAAVWADRLAASGSARFPAGPLSGRAETFTPCVQCQTCTNVCPVVAHGGGGAALDRADVVDLTPQKVMNLLRLGLRDWALGARMTWDCATCYQCQESCPEGIPVTDVLYELRALAWQRLRSLEEAAPLAPPAPPSAPAGDRKEEEA